MTRWMGLRWSPGVFVLPGCLLIVLSGCATPAMYQGAVESYGNEISEVSSELRNDIASAQYTARVELVLNRHRAKKQNDLGAYYDGLKKALNDHAASKDFSNETLFAVNFLCTPKLGFSDIQAGLQALSTHARIISASSKPTEESLLALLSSIQKHSSSDSEELISADYESAIALAAKKDQTCLNQAFVDLDLIENYSLEQTGQESVRLAFETLNKFKALATTLLVEVDRVARAVYLRRFIKRNAEEIDTVINLIDQRSGDLERLQDKTRRAHLALPYLRILNLAKFEGDLVANLETVRELDSSARDAQSSVHATNYKNLVAGLRGAHDSLKELARNDLSQQQLKDLYQQIRTSVDTVRGSLSGL